MTDRPSDQELPPLDLGEAGTPDAAHDAGERPRRPGDLRRPLALAVAFAVGALAGAAFWQARVESLRATDVRLVAAVVDWEVLARAEPQVAPATLDEVLLTVSLHNGGTAPLTVTRLTPVGWQPVGRLARRQVELPAGRWTTSAWTTLPRCADRPPDALHIDVRGPAAEIRTRVDLPGRAPALIEAWARTCEREERRRAAVRDERPAGGWEPAAPRGARTRT